MWDAVRLRGSDQANRHGGTSGHSSAASVAASDDVHDGYVYASASSGAVAVISTINENLQETYHRNRSSAGLVNRWSGGAVIDGQGDDGRAVGDLACAW